MAPHKGIIALQQFISCQVLPSHRKPTPSFEKRLLLLLWGFVVRGTKSKPASPGRCERCLSHWDPPALLMPPSLDRGPALGAPSHTPAYGLTPSDLLDFALQVPLARSGALEAPTFTAGEPDLHPTGHVPHFDVHFSGLRDGCRHSLHRVISAAYAHRPHGAAA